MKLKCPSCEETEVEWVSNIDMERTHKWVWRVWNGEERLLCPACAREGYSVETDSYMRRGTKVSNRST